MVWWKEFDCSFNQLHRKTAEYQIPAPASMSYLKISFDSPRTWLHLPQDPPWETQVFLKDSLWGMRGLHKLAGDISGVTPSGPFNNLLQYLQVTQTLLFHGELFPLLCAVVLVCVCACARTGGVESSDSWELL